MPITPWPVGNLAPVWTISIVPDSGVVAVAGLVVGNFALLIHNLSTGVVTGGVGTFSTITAAVTTGSGSSLVIVSHASVQYQAAAGDVLTVGRNRVWLVVTFANGPQGFDLGVWEVEAL